MNQVAQAIEQLLASRWEPNASAVDGRNNDVPQPVFVQAGETKGMSEWPERDYAFVRYAGVVDREAMGVGWKEELVTVEVNVDIRTADSQERLHGTRTSPGNDPEPYGGLSGEVERVCDNVRDGYKEFRSVDFYNFDDRTEEYDFGRWAGFATIRLKEFDSNIDA